MITNNLHNKISTKFNRTLNINMEDHNIIIQKVGKSNNEKIYLWSIINPDEIGISSSSEVIKESKLMERLDLFVNKDKLNDEEKMSFNLFFGETNLI